MVHLKRESSNHIFEALMAWEGQLANLDAGTNTRESVVLVRTERLAQIKTHARHYIARRPEHIHLKSRHLGTLQTQSGWWISTNVSEQQVEKAFKLLAEAAHLSFGKDVIFPLRDQLATSEYV